MKEEEQEDRNEIDEDNLPLIDRIDHPKWKVRMSAYKEISSLFYNEYSTSCVKDKNSQDNEQE